MRGKSFKVKIDDMLKRKHPRDLIRNALITNPNQGLVPIAEQSSDMHVLELMKHAMALEKKKGSEAGQHACTVGGWKPGGVGVISSPRVRFYERS